MFKIISQVPFNSVIDGSRVATEVATLLNKNNNLSKPYSSSRIINSNTLYLVYLYNGCVVGCTGLKQEHPNLTRNLHTSIAKEFRHNGLGTFIVYKAVVECNTTYIRAHVRADNINSLKLYNQLGFKVYHRYNNGKANINDLWRRAK